MSLFRFGSNIVALRNISSAFNSAAKTSVLSLDLCPVRYILPTSIINNKVIFYSTNIPNQSDADSELDFKEDRLGGFAKAYQRFSTPEVKPEEKEQTFLQLLKNSKFIDVSIPPSSILLGIQAQLNSRAVMRGMCPSLLHTFSGCVPTLCSFYGGNIGLGLIGWYELNTLK